MITRHKPSAPLPWKAVDTKMGMGVVLVDQGMFPVQIYGAGSEKNLRFIAEAANIAWLARRVREQKTRASREQLRLSHH
jgi:hypothetical protein